MGIAEYRTLTGQRILIKRVRGTNDAGYSQTYCNVIELAADGSVLRRRKMSSGNCEQNYAPMPTGKYRVLDHQLQRYV